MFIEVEPAKPPIDTVMALNLPAGQHLGNVRGDARCGSKGDGSLQITSEILPLATSNPLTANRRIYIGKLPYPIPQDNLLLVFNNFGKITAFSPHSGFAFLEYEDEKSPLKAIQAMDGKEFMKRKLSIHFILYY